MSDTIVDMAKVTQMLDAGWRVIVFKNGMGSYEARAKHPNEAAMARVRTSLIEGMAENRNFLQKTKQTAAEAVDAIDFDDDGWLMTDEFTPEQALTRLAYKVHGEIL